MRKNTNFYYNERTKGRWLSAAFHLLFLVISLVGLPSFMKPPLPEEPPAISVEILPISQISNVKPAEKPPAPDVKPEEPKPEPKKPSPPVKTADPVPPPPPEKVIEKPKDKPAEIKKEKPPEPKKEEKKIKPKEDDLAAILKAVKETAQNEKKDEKPKDKPKDSGSQSKSISNKYNPDLPMSMSERDVIMSQLAKCWNVPAGAKDAQDLVVVVEAEYNVDGSFIKVGLAQESMGRYNADTFFRAAADSALRAVKLCSPLTNLPPEKYETWRLMELRFDPKFMLN
jgi:outer membrane biosynthesis protein TonB